MILISALRSEWLFYTKLLKIQIGAFISHRSPDTNSISMFFSSCSIVPYFRCLSLTQTYLSYRFLILYTTIISLPCISLCPYYQVSLLWFREMARRRWQQLEVILRRDLAFSHSKCKTGDSRSRTRIFVVAKLMCVFGITSIILLIVDVPK